MKIAFFDSGIGGLNVLADALKIMPNEKYLYYGDIANVPYGNKSKDEVKQCVLNAVEFLVKKNIKALVIACNAATSAAANELRKIYDFPIIGMEPAVKPAVTQNDGKRILVLSTVLTLKEQKFNELVAKVDREGLVDTLALPGLVNFAERFEFSPKEINPYLKEQLAAFDLHKYHVIVLGCTHFLFYKDILQNLLPKHVKILDGSQATVKHLKDVLTNSGLLHPCDWMPTSCRHDNTKVEFYFGGEQVTDIARIKFMQDLLGAKQSSK